RAVSVEHHGPVGAYFLARCLDRIDHATDIGRVPGVIVDTMRRHLVSLVRRVNANAVAARATEQPVNGYAPEFSSQVPQGHVDAGDGMDHERTAAHVPMGTVQFLPEVFDPRRVFAAQQLKERLGQGLGGPRFQGADLAPASYILIGVDLHINSGAYEVSSQPFDADASAFVFDAGCGTAGNGFRHEPAASRGRSDRSNELAAVHT